MFPQRVRLWCGGGLCVGLLLNRQHQNLRLHGFCLDSWSSLMFTGELQWTIPMVTGYVTGAYNSWTIPNIIGAISCMIHVYPVNKLHGHSPSTLTVLVPIALIKPAIDKTVGVLELWLISLGFYGSIRCRPTLRVAMTKVSISSIYIELPWYQHPCILPQVFLILKPWNHPCAHVGHGKPGVFNINRINISFI